VQTNTKITKWGIFCLCNTPKVPL